MEKWISRYWEVCRKQEVTHPIFFVPLLLLLLWPLTVSYWCYCSLSSSDPVAGSSGASSGSHHHLPNRELAYLGSHASHMDPPLLRTSSSIKASSSDDPGEENLLSAKIEMLRLENARLLQELKQQDDYDKSRGIPPGKFREHFTMHCIGES